MDECSSGLLQQRKELTAYINFYTPFLSITSDNTLPQNNNNISSGGGDDDDDDGLKKVLEEAKGKCILIVPACKSRVCPCGLPATLIDGPK